MKNINKNSNQNDKIKKKRESRVKRKISILTIMLWVFLISTIITITVNSTKKTNALEVEDENWNIELVMYDRSSDTPNQAITEFIWNAVSSDERKQLCMQINYACTTGKQYQPGEIEITVPGIAKDNFSEYNRSRYSDWLKNNVIIAADKVSDNNKGYDFSYSFDEEKNLYTFTNNEAIAKNEHFEGSIQLVYDLFPRFKIQTDLEFKAKMKENIENAEEIIAKESNICNFHYTSTKKTYNLENIAVAGQKKDYTKIEDILDNYYWVEYKYKASELSEVIFAYGKNNRNVISYNDSESIKTSLPNECVMYDNSLNKVEPKEENTYYYLVGGRKYYVGYPKSKYSEGDKITNTAELWGRYEDEKEMQKLAEASSVVSLVNFNFEYTGNLYRITKSGGGSCRLNALKNGGDENYWDMETTAIYTDSVMDVEIGDDLLYITRENGEVTKLEDNEYNFTRIDIPVFYTYNKYTGTQGDALIGYNYELHARYRNTNEWRVIYEGVTTTGMKYTPQVQENLTINTDDIVGLKVVIKDLDKTLTQNYMKVYIKIYTKDCNIGKIYNFNYLQVYKKDESGNRILANEPTLDSYSTESTKLKVAENDINTYGVYMQRAHKTADIKDGYFGLNVKKSSYKRNINKEKKQYEIEYWIENELSLISFEVNKDCIIKTYDILPIGMELNSTKEEIIDSIRGLSYENLKLKDGAKFSNADELNDFIKKNTKIDIDYNYKDSGRTKISIIYNLNQIDWSYYLDKSIGSNIRIKIETKIPYDNIAENGTRYENYVYSMWNNQEYKYNSYNVNNDNGKYDLLANDIDEDGDTTEKIVYSYDTFNIIHAVSSKQAVIKQVRTDLTKGEFIEDTADVTAGSEYTYKLRVSTGENSIKDLIIYDNLETIIDSEGNHISNGWNGKFLGVDTSYALSKGYAPKVYYSEEINPGKLTEVPEKWIELTNEVDKTCVKSICVDLRYKSDGTEMELSSNNVVFVLINMQAPEDDTIITSAKNMFSTNWRAKDPLGTVIDNVEGIYSNQVNVNIYKEENRKQDISGKKIWNDSGNISNTRPESIIIKLLQDGVEYGRCEVTEDSNWKYRFENIPVYKNSELEKYEYRIEEEKVPYYETTYDGYNVINTLSGKDIKGKKIWKDSGNISNTRPESITVKLMQDGIEYRRCNVTEGNKWEYSFEDVPMYKNDSGEEYEYSIEEVEVPGYESKVEYDERNDKYNITNTLKTTNLEVTKIWDDNENEHSLRPNYVLIKLFEGDNYIDSKYISEYDNWKAIFEYLPEFRSDGSKIEYRIEEEVEEVVGDSWDRFDNFNVENGFELYNKYYITQIVGNVVTNKYVDPDERIKITGKKVWEDNNNKAFKRPESVVLQIKNGDKVVSEGIVTKDTNWSYEFEVAKYDEEGNEIEYHIDEKETPKFYEKELTDELTVTNKFKVPDERIKVEVIKLWEDLDNKYSKRTNKITLQVYNEEKVVAEQVVDEKRNWRYEFELPKYNEYGNEIEYTVDEKEEVKYYEKRVSGYTVINKCIYEPITDTSDVNIFLYIVIFFIAIIGIVVGILFIRKNKLSKK